MLKKFFTSEVNMLVAIAINAVVIFLLYFPEINSEAAPNYFLINLDHFFVLFFTMEAVVKISALKPKAYFSDSWNVFDFFIVIISLPSLLAFVPLFAHLNFSVLKVLRLFRMIRLVKLVKFVPHMDMIIAGLGRALKASVFVLVVLLMLNFMLSLFTCHFYGELVPELFGNPGIASYTIFQMFTVEGWNEIPQLVASRLDSYWLIGLSRFYFVMIVLMGGIFGMSLANAIFVDEMTMDNNQDLEEKIDGLYKEIQELKSMLKGEE